MWYKDAGGNFFVPLPSKDAPALEAAAPRVEDELSRAIVEAESSSMWTLMHRYNKAADLIRDTLNGYFDSMPTADAFSRIYIWLRYSSTRHITWQRNYNTQPRILSAAQERLTSTVADAHSRSAGEQEEGRDGVGGAGPGHAYSRWPPASSAH